VKEGRLALSSNRGRYAIAGVDLNSGDCIEIYLGGNFIAGSIEHSASPIYADEHGMREVDDKPPAISGYYFIAEVGESFAGVCGLCADMRVRIP
jgi:hypothetical protein